MVIRTFVAALCAFLVCAPAAAQSGTQSNGWNDEEVITSFDISDLAAMAQAMGHEVVSNTAEATMLVSAKTPEGLVYGMALTSCTDDVDCKGIRMQVIYDLPANVTEARVNAVNARYAAVTMVSDQSSSRLAISRYVILDFGVRRKNVRANLAVLLQSVAPALKMLNEES